LYDLLTSELVLAYILDQFQIGLLRSQS